MKRTLGFYRNSGLSIRLHFILATYMSNYLTIGVRGEDIFQMFEIAYDALFSAIIKLFDTKYNTDVNEIDAEHLWRDFYQIWRSKAVTIRVNGVLPQQQSLEEAIFWKQLLYPCAQSREFYIEKDEFTKTEISEALKPILEQLKRHEHQLLEVVIRIFTSAYYLLSEGQTIRNPGSRKWQWLRANQNSLLRLKMSQGFLRFLHSFAYYCGALYIEKGRSGQEQEYAFSLAESCSFSLENDDKRAPKAAEIFKDEIYHGFKKMESIIKGKAD